MFYWILLGLTTAAEIADALPMKRVSVGHDNSGFTLTLVMIASSYIFLSFAVKKIALGVTYTLQEGIGILFTTLLNALLSDETLSTMKVAGLVSLILGIVLIKLSTRKSARTSKEVTRAAV